MKKAIILIYIFMMLSALCNAQTKDRPLTSKHAIDTTAYNYVKLKYGFELAYERHFFDVKALNSCLNQIGYPSLNNSDNLLSFMAQFSYSVYDTAKTQGWWNELRNWTGEHCTEYLSFETTPGNIFGKQIDNFRWSDTTLSRMTYTMMSLGVKTEFNLTNYFTTDFSLGFVIAWYKLSLADITQTSYIAGDYIKSPPKLFEFTNNIPGISLSAGFSVRLKNEFSSGHQQFTRTAMIGLRLSYLQFFSSGGNVDFEDQSGLQLRQLYMKPPSGFKLAVNISGYDLIRYFLN